MCERHDAGDRVIQIASGRGGVCTTTSEHMYFSPVTFWLAPKERRARRPWTSAWLIEIQGLNKIENSFRTRWWKIPVICRGITYKQAIDAFRCCVNYSIQSMKGRGRWNSCRNRLRLYRLFTYHQLHLGGLANRTKVVASLSTQWDRRQHQLLEVSVTLRRCFSANRRR